MKEIIEVLKAHHKKYPYMQIEDVIKLLYQNELGGGHLIKNIDDSLNRLFLEYNSIAHFEDKIKLEDIGNNVIRVYLDSYKGDLNKLNEAFVKSANDIIGSKCNLIKKIEFVKEYIKYNNFFNFEYEEFERFVSMYYSEGLPMMSHSDVYRENYNPHYRVILKSVYEEMIDNS